MRIFYLSLTMIAFSFLLGGCSESGRRNELGKKEGGSQENNQNHEIGNRDNLAVKVGDVKMHENSGIRISVNSRDVAAGIATIVGATSEQESEKSAKVAYEYSKKNRLDNVLFCKAVFPNGTSREIWLSNNNEPVYYKPNGAQHYRIDITDVKKSFGTFTVYFKFSPMTEGVQGNDPLGVDDRGGYESQATDRKHIHIQKRIVPGETYNDNISELRVYVKSVDSETQTIVADYQIPEAKIMKDTLLNAGEFYRFSSHGHSYRFRIREIDGSFCEFEVKEQ